MFVLDAYAARSCPVKTHNAFHPGLALPEVTAEHSRLPGRAEFSAGVLATILTSAPGRVVDCRPLVDRPSAEQEAACLQALDEGADVVIGGLLPRDWQGHRSGRPDLLIRDAEHPGAYHPAQVKYQRIVDPRKDDVPFSYSELTDPVNRIEVPGFRYRWHWRSNNGLQLAHYWRLLESSGHASPGRRWAAVVGIDDLPELGTVLTWVDLDALMLQPGPDQEVDPERGPMVSALERYDHEHRRRVEIAENAASCSPEDPPQVRPIVTRECSWCSWWSTCRPQLDEDDLSLRISKSPLDVHEIAVLREMGLTTVSDLAAADLDQVLPDYLPRVSHRPGSEDRLRLARRRALLLQDGIELDRTTTGPIDVPAAPLEIDIDVETSREDRVYLWGFWVADNATGQTGYRQFSAFRELDDEAELELARAALSWLRDQVAGRDARVYHYSDYELVRIDRLAKAADDPVLGWAKDFARDRFVDLFTPVRQHFFGTNGLGLKVVASKGAGFAWRDDDPGGLNSMRWFEDAVRADSAEDRERARTRVLEYNEDDVRATWHVRRWLREQR